LALPPSPHLTPYKPAVPAEKERQGGNEPRKNINQMQKSVRYTWQARRDSVYWRRETQKDSRERKRGLQKMKRKPECRIDAVRTGKYLKQEIYNRGYSVKEIQEYLNLACPQSIYRWFNGRVLPSVDHLYALARLLGVHMEQMLCPEQEKRVDRREREGQGRGQVYDLCISVLRQGFFHEMVLFERQTETGRELHLCQYGVWLRELAVG